MPGETCPFPGWEPNNNLTTQELWDKFTEQEKAEAIDKLPTFFLLSLLMVLGLPGNLLVLLVYGIRFPSSTTKSFIMAMATFDLMNCLMGMPFEMVDLRNDMTLDIPAACKILRFIVTLSACGSVTVLVVVSVDRFRRICRPFQRQMTVMQSKLVIGAMTVVSLAFSFPALVLYGKQTDNRFGVTLYDCAIDDKYNRSKVAAAYQFSLGAMWVICVTILIIMYGFIIYKIRKQKKRREKLSSQSFGSAILTKVKKSVDETNIPGNMQNIHSSSSRNGSIDNGILSAEESAGGQGHDSNKSTPGRRSFSHSLRRLFSRDVNPIFEEAEDNDEIDDVNFYTSNGDIISLPDRSCRTKSVDTTKASLNNYLAGSQDNELIRRSEITVTYAQDDRSVTPSRSRKLGHSLGRYRPWESEEIIRHFSIVNSRVDREWTSHSCPLLETKETVRLKYGYRMRRASSLPSLKGLGKLDRKTPQHRHSSLESAESGRGGRESDTENESNTSVKIQLGTDNISNENSLGSVSNVMENSTRNHHANVTWDSAEVTTCDIEYTLERKMSDQPKSRSASVATTLTQAYKRKFSTREIKTSKVSIMMLMVTVAFVLSYLPHLCIQVFRTVFPATVTHLLCTDQTYFIFHHFLMRSFFINNAINPIIYSFYNKTFRRRCVRLLKAPRSLFQSSEPHGSGPSFSQDNDTS